MKIHWRRKKVVQRDDPILDFYGTLKRGAVKPSTLKRNEVRK